MEISKEVEGDQIDLDGVIKTMRRTRLQPFKSIER